ncbi:protein LITTLE ZIPPER 2-like isoform X1 [Durio zibethinus]|uniref:Protein LITTLE ZIPPER 2-like isoform X1 n=1 Tax=Durio zibethinus TaxID=66656 RepID=A0A6P6A3F3_DURZI|nr:protein LITTLE ZIPPER 2-like isoform X1 [Durio zibethinus]
MCIYSSESIPIHSFCRKRSSNRHNIRVRRLNSIYYLKKKCNRWRRSRKGAGTKKMAVSNIKTDMQMRNLKLYMENQSIIEENERLRKKALLLQQENRTLLAQLQKKFSNPQNHS